MDRELYRKWEEYLHHLQWVSTNMEEWDHKSLSLVESLSMELSDHMSQGFVQGALPQLGRENAQPAMGVPQNGGVGPQAPQIGGVPQHGAVGPHVPLARLEGVPQHGAVGPHVPLAPAVIVIPQEGANTYHTLKEWEHCHI